MMRLLTPDDAAALRLLRLEALAANAEAFGADEADELKLADEDFAGKITDPLNVFIGAFDDQKLVGCVALTRGLGAKRQHKATVWFVYVCASQRGQNMAFQLLTRLEQHAQKMGIKMLLLDVTEKCAVALHVYEKLGFTQWGVQKKCLLIDRQYVDCYHLQKELAGQGWF